MGVEITRRRLLLGGAAAGTIALIGRDRWVNREIDIVHNVNLLPHSPRFPSADLRNVINPDTKEPFKDEEVLDEYARFFTKPSGLSQDSFMKQYDSSETDYKSKKVGRHIFQPTYRQLVAKDTKTGERWVERDFGVVGRVTGMQMSDETLLISAYTLTSFGSVRGTTLQDHIPYSSYEYRVFGVTVK